MALCANRFAKRVVMSIETVQLMFSFYFFERELQYLADQEKISATAIKKTTLDKVLQQPGVTADAVGVRSGGISIFNSSKPRTKKK